MLPGFRFLFAAIVLSVSVLIFGLGAAALLRAAHEQFASIPSRRTPPEQVFTRQNDPMTPTLALLRVEPEVAEKVPGTIGSTAILEAVTPAAPTPETSQAEPEKLAALKTEEPVEPVKTEAPMAETAPVIQDAPVETPAAETPAADQEVKLAAIAETPAPVTAAAPTAPEPVVEAPSLANNPAALKIATLGGPAVPILETAPAKVISAKPEDPSVNRKQAQRAKERRRIAARRARQAASAQQAADPFAQPTARRTP